MIEAIGTARANESLDITAKMTETVRSINFTEGATVEAGAVLVELASTTLRAPFSGVLGLRAVSPGELVNPGDKIVTLDDISDIKLDFSVPETSVRAREGRQIVRVTAAYPARAFDGIVRMDTRVDPVTRAIACGRRFRMRGAYAPRHADDRRAITTPPLHRSARGIARADGKAAICLRRRGGKVEQRWVEIGARRPGLVEISSGLAEGDGVVVEGTNARARAHPSA